VRGREREELDVGELYPCASTAGYAAVLSKQLFSRQIQKKSKAENSGNSGLIKKCFAFLPYFILMRKIC